MSYKYVRFHIAETIKQAQIQNSIDDNEKRLYASRSMLRLCCMTDREVRLLARCYATRTRSQLETYKILKNTIDDYQRTAYTWVPFICRQPDVICHPN